jgi:nicotinic acid mononucleotide adenylyltransferase
MVSYVLMLYFQWSNVPSSEALAGRRRISAYGANVNKLWGFKGLAPAEHRIKLCQLATSDSQFVMVDPWEV